MDLQSLLERIDLQGGKQEPTAVDEVAEAIKTRLNIRVEDDAIFKSLASQLLGVAISTPNQSNSTASSKEEHASSSSSGSPASPSNTKNPELQKTWSGETASTVNTQRNLPTVDTIDGSTSNGSSPLSLDQQQMSSDLQTNHSHRGRSPLRRGENNKSSSNTEANGGRRSLTVDGKPPKRSQSPFRRVVEAAGKLFTSSNKSKEFHVTKPANLNTDNDNNKTETPLRTRSFDKPGTPTNNRPPMSPYPCAVNSSFGSTIPPTPTFSILGVATPGQLSFMSPEFCTPMSETPTKSNNNNSNSTSVNTPSMPPHQQQYQQEINELGRGRERARTPSQDRNPGIFTSSCTQTSRSQSLPRVNSKLRMPSPFRNISPGRVLRQRLSSKTDSEAAKGPHQQQQRVQPMQEAASIRNVNTKASDPTPGTESPVQGTPSMPMQQTHHQFDQQETVFPKSSPLKRNDEDCVTGKYKHRRKTESAIGSLSGDSLAFEREIVTPLDSPPVFNVNLSNGGGAPKQRGKKTNRRSTAPHVVSQHPMANPPPMQQQSATQTPVPTINTSVESASPEPVLSPMETEGHIDTCTEINCPAATTVSSMGISSQNIGPGSVQFSIGGKGPTKKSTKQRSRGARNPQRPNFTQPATAAEPMPNPASPSAAQRDAAVLSRVVQMREEGKRLYQNEEYLAAIQRYNDAIRLYGDLHQTTPGDMLALLLANRAACLLTIRAPRACMSDCTLGLTYVASSPAPPQYFLSTNEGPVLKIKLHIRLARALLRIGDASRAEHELNTAIETAESTMIFCQQVHNTAEVVRNKDILSHLVGEATLEKEEARKLILSLGQINRINLPNLKATSSSISLTNKDLYVKALSHVGAALAIAPCNVKLHETKVALLASLRRWREMANHCERLAAANVLLDWGGSMSRLSDDRAAMKLLPNIPPAEKLTANYFVSSIVKEDFKISDFESASYKIAKDVAKDAILRVPISLTEVYVRALRLEERYPPAEVSLNGLEQYIRSQLGTPDYARLYQAFDWHAREQSKLTRTKKTRNLADEKFRSGDFEGARQLYGKCLSIDAEDVKGTSLSGNFQSGGRLHAVLHCNRAACLMSLKQHQEAIKECSSALRIHGRYMKALLRRGRCYARLQRFEEAIADLLEWIKLVEHERKSPESGDSFVSPCLFDGPKDVKDDEIGQVKKELEDFQRQKLQKENSAREQAGYNQQREKFHNKFSDAQRRRDEWYNQQGAGTSRRWDSFDNGPGSKRSPKKKNKGPQQSYTHSSDSRWGFPNGSTSSHSRRGSAHGANGYASRPESNLTSAAGTHYGTLGVTCNATEAEIKKAYRKVIHCGPCSLKICTTSFVFDLLIRFFFVVAGSQVSPR